MRIRPLFLLLLFTLCLNLEARTATWLKSWVTMGAFAPDTVILRTGILKKNGEIADRLSKSDEAQLCKYKGKRVAWIVRRLSKSEKLAPEAGTRFAKTFLKRSYAKCFEEIELDIEPLPDNSQWILPFLKNARKELKGKPLRLAIPAISEKTIAGIFWGTKWATSVLREVDALDIMLYDTGTTQKMYSGILRQAVLFAQEVQKSYPKKQILLGLPAYQDRTRLHRLDVENLSNVYNFLDALPQSMAKTFCSDQLAIAYYAGWTMTEKDKQLAGKIDRWRNHVCTR